jgi:aspartyl-tRNA synthetase
MRSRCVTLCGWVHRRRDHGKLIFIDIRDRYGITQVVFVPGVSKQAHEVAQQLGPEYVIKVTGDVVVRSERNINKDIPTGEIELCAQELEILNTSKTPVFEVDEDRRCGRGVAPDIPVSGLAAAERSRRHFKVRHQLMCGYSPDRLIRKDFLILKRLS